MNHVLIFVHPDKTGVQHCTEDAYEVEAFVDQLKEAEWIKILSEYIPIAKTRVIILATEGPSNEES